MVPEGDYLLGVPRRSSYSDETVNALIAAHERVVTHAELVAVGVPKSTIVTRIGPGGAWQRILPGVVLCHAGTATHRERLLAAVKYAGSQAVLTGSAALGQYHIRASVSGRVHVLIPHTSQRTSHHFVTVERTRKLPRSVMVNGLPLAPISRAVVDDCRRGESLGDVRAVVAEVVQRQRCRPDQLQAALAAAARQRTALTIAALGEVAAGIRSVAEAKARVRVRRSQLPDMEWNLDLYANDGRFIGSPDGWYDDVGVALQIDSMEYHLRPALYKRTQQLLKGMTRRGILVLSIAPSDVDADPGDFIAALADLRYQGSLRPRPDVVAVRRTGTAA